MLPLFSLIFWLFCLAIFLQLSAGRYKAVWEEHVTLIINTESFSVSLSAIVNTIVQSLKEWPLISLEISGFHELKMAFFFWGGTWDSRLVTKQPPLNSLVSIDSVNFLTFTAYVIKTEILMYGETLHYQFFVLFLNFQIHCSLCMSQSSKIYVTLSRVTLRQVANELYWLGKRCYWPEFKWCLWPLHIPGQYPKYNIRCLSLLLSFPCFSICLVCWAYSRCGLDPKSIPWALWTIGTLQRKTVSISYIIVCMSPRLVRITRKPLENKPVCAGGYGVGHCW